MLTVRVKLLLLAALTVVTTLVTLLVVGWLLSRQIAHEIDANVESAGHAYEAQLEAELTTVRLTVAVFSSSSDVRGAIAKHDFEALADVTAAYARLYPDLDIALYDGQGQRLGRIGCDEDGAPLADPSFLDRLRTSGEAVDLSERGCDRTPMPTYLVGRRVALEGSLVGYVVVGLDFSAAHLAASSKKLGMELALVDATGRVVQETPGYGAALRSGVLKPFRPSQLQVAHHDYELRAAVDTSPVRAAVARSLRGVLVVLLLAGAVALATGLRMARGTSNAVTALGAAFGRLKAQDYAHVTGVRTGDELEDLATAFNRATDGLHERDKLRTTFGKYMTASVMEHLLAGKVSLGGEMLTATIVFSDIRSFTTLSEKMTAAQVVSLLNEYFTEMVDAIVLEDGVVDKYIGDAILAVFGVPVTGTQDALRAVRAAVGMRDALVRLNDRLVARNIAPIRTGIGLHTGEVVAGNIGSERRMEYTVIGDAVNVALRLEGATKELGVAVLLSDETYQLVRDHVEATPLGPVAVKGRAEPVTALALRGLRSRA